MAIDFREVDIYLDPASGGMNTETQLVPFGRQVRRASAALKSMRIGFTDDDHHFYRETIQIEAGVSDQSDQAVRVTVHYLLRDHTGNIDDRYDGQIEVMVIADVAD